MEKTYPKKNIMKTNFIKKLRYLRRKKNLLQSELSRLLGYNSNVVGLWETEKTGIPFNTILNLQDVLGFDLIIKERIVEEEKEELKEEIKEELKKKLKEM